jgi:sulfite exporter TauE/SafE
VTLAVAVLLASLLGSVHCAAMCGAFTCLYAPGDAHWRQTLGAQVAYNVGRLGAYLTLGVIAGVVGASVQRTGALAGIGNAAALVTAVLLVVWGTHALLVAGGARVAAVRPPAAWQRAMGSVLQRVMHRPPTVRAAATGLLTTLLPCGWLYAFVVTAAGTGTPIRAAAVMAAFWVGTLPMMLTVGLGLQRLAGPLRARLPMVSATTILLFGLLSLAAHLDLVPATHWLHRLMPAVPVASAVAPTPTGHAH